MIIKTSSYLLAQIKVLRIFLPRTWGLMVSAMGLLTTMMVSVLLMRGSVVWGCMVTIMVGAFSLAEKKFISNNES